MVDVQSSTTITDIPIEIYLRTAEDPHFAIFGSVECGKTNLLRLIVHGVQSRLTSNDARILVVDYRGSLMGIDSSGVLCQVLRRCRGYAWSEGGHRVAVEAGVSMGQVRHYFSTQDEMPAYTFKSLSSQVEQRLRAAADDSGERPPPPRVLLRTLLRATVHLDASSGAEPH